MDKILSPTNDVVFKKLFGDAKNTDILKAFLQSVIEIPAEEYDEISIIDPAFRVEHGNDKASILDIKIRTKSNHTINVEVQVLPQPDMNKRLTYYTAKMLTEQMSKGDAYGEIKKAVNITILDYNLLPQNQSYNHRFMLYDSKNDVVLSDDMSIHTLELGKLPEEHDGSDLYDWLSFFRSKERNEFDMLAQKNKDVKKAVVKLVELSADEETRMLAEAREKALRDDRSRIESAEKKGIEKGIEKGRQEEKLEIAKKMYENDVNYDTIKTITELSDDELESLDIQNKGIKHGM